MVSEPKGQLFVPVWIDAGIVKALISDAGTLPVTESAPLTELDVTLKASDITLPTSEQSPLTSIQSQGYGYIGSAWQKQPLIWGYSDVYSDTKYEADVPAADKVIQFDTVPTGEIWVVTVICAYSAQANVSRIEFQPKIDGVSVPLVYEPPAGALHATVWQGIAPMKKDDYLEVIFRGCALNDDLWAMVGGYKMSIDL